MLMHEAHRVKLKGVDFKLEKFHMPSVKISINRYVIYPKGLIRGLFSEIKAGVTFCLS